VEPFAQTQIDGVNYRLRPMNPELVLQHGSKLTALVAGPAVQQAMSKFSLPEQGKIADVVVPLLGQVLGEALKQLSHPDVQAALMACVATATIYHPENGAEAELSGAWKAHFIGKPGSLVRFLKWAATEQYGGFFSAMPDFLAGGLRERIASLASSAATTRAASSPTT
jgi:hypothetical protein